ncbi:hypothetical protein LEP1GSC198_3689 [Leptospira kirschneri str. JB]|nr:hypothetical protein LEP1GSC198_3689 [Leptospira kirschneri str. JB]
MKNSSRDSQNCFHYPFQYNENKWIINFLTILLLSFTR